MSDFKAKIKQKQHKGFTLIEAVVSLAVTALLVTLILFYLGTLSNLSLRNTKDYNLETAKQRLTQLLIADVQSAKTVTTDSDSLVIETGEGSTITYLSDAAAKKLTRTVTQGDEHSEETLLENYVFPTAENGLSDPFVLDETDNGVKINFTFSNTNNLELKLFHPVASGAEVVDWPVLATGEAWLTKLSDGSAMTDTQIAKIKSAQNVSFVRSGFVAKDVIENAALIVDCSKDADGSVLAYLTADGKSLMIAPAGGKEKAHGIKANENSSHMFDGFTALKEISGLATISTEDVTDMSNMFTNCTALESFNLSNFNMNKVTTLSGMFQGCTRLGTVVFGGKYLTGVTDTSYLFSGCTSLTNVDLTTAVFCTDGGAPALVNTSGMFYSCTALRAIDTTYLNTTNVPVGNMTNMFTGCSNLTKFVLGKNFRFDKNNSSAWLPAPNSEFIVGAADKWYSETGTDYYTPEELANYAYTCGRASVETYSAVRTSAIKELAIDAKSAKTDYKTGETLNTKDLVITAYYENGDSQILSVGDCTFKPSVSERLMNVGETTITVSHTERGKTATGTYNVTVEKADLKSISISQMPSKTEYIQNHVSETLSTVGGKIKLIYTDDSVSYMDMSDGMASGFSNKTVGKNTITVTYKGETTSFDVTIVPYSLSSIAISHSPDMTAYYNHAKLNYSGLSITASYNNGRTSDPISYAGNQDKISISPAEGTTVEKTGEDKLDTRTITVTYTESGKSASCTFDVTVCGDPILASGKTWYTEHEKSTNPGISITKKVKEIAFVTELPAGKDYTDSWDASEAGDNSVTAYLSGSVLYLSSNGAEKVIANSNSADAFADLMELTTVTELDKLDTSVLRNASGLFRNDARLTTITASDLHIGNTVTDISNMFSGCAALTSVDTTGWNTENVTDFSGIFDSCQKLTSITQNFNTAKAITMANMFHNCFVLLSVNVSGFTTSQVTDMSGMFYGCQTLGNVDLTAWAGKAQTVTDISDMFHNCYQMTSIDISAFNGHNLVNMSNAFANCDALKSLNLSGVNTENVTDMSGMLGGCTVLKTVDVGSFNTSNVTSMKNMFYACVALTTICTNNELFFDTTSVTDMSGMFAKCESMRKLDISNFDTTKSPDMTDMFADMNRLSEITLGENFAFNGIESYLPTPSDTYISGADGSWYKNIASSAKYTPTAIAGLTRTGDETYIAVAIHELKNIAIKKNPDKTVYTAGEDMVLDGMVLTATYSDGKKVDISNERTLDKNGYFTDDARAKNMTNGTSSIIVKYADGDKVKECIVSITVDKVMESISITTLPKQNYKQGESDNLDLTGGKVTVTYNDSTTQVLDLSDALFTVTGFDKDTSGTQTITVSYTEGEITKTTTFSVYVTEREVTGIAVKNAAKTAYRNGDALDTTGLSILVTYSDGKTEEKTDNFVAILYGADGNATASTEVLLDNGVKQTVKILYFSKETSYTISVMGEPVLAPGTNWYKSSMQDYSTITTIHFLNEENDACVGETWDASAAGDESVMCYRNGATVYIVGCGDGHIYANKDSHGFFGSRTADGKTALQTITGLSVLDTSRTTNMSDMFLGCAKLSSLDVSSFVTSSVTDMSGMFDGCTALSSVTMTGWDTGKLENMSRMFADCTTLTAMDLSVISPASVTNMSSVFSGDSALTSVTFGDSFGTYNVQDMSNLFNGCEKIASLDLSGIYVSSSANTAGMFDGMVRLASVTIGTNFNFVSSDGYLPIPSSSYITGADGSWYHNEKGTYGMTPKQVAEEVRDEATTYIAVPIIALERIVVTQSPDKTTYYVGNAFDKTGMVVRAEYSNGTSKIINDYTVEENGTSIAVNQQYVTISYTDTEIGDTVTCEVPIQVVARMSSISVFSNPTKTEYLQNSEKLDCTGGKLEITYEDETTKTIDLTNSMVTGFDNTTAGEQSLTVTYTEAGVTKTCSFTVSIVSRVLDSISVHTNPTKMAYANLEALDLSGLKITLHYNNGETETVDKGFTTDPANGSAIEKTDTGKKTITVTYGEKTCTFEVDTAGDPILAPGDTWHEDLSDITFIRSITFQDTYTATDSELSQWDASAEKDKSVNAYLVSNTELVIAGDGSGYIYANEDSSHMFDGFAALEEINGFALVDVSNTTNGAYMFNDCASLRTLDLSKWDNSTMSNMAYMFQNCSALESITLSADFKFNGSNSELPIPSSAIDRADGLWYDKDPANYNASATGYTPSALKALARTEEKTFTAKAPARLDYITAAYVDDNPGDETAPHPKTTYFEHDNLDTNFLVVTAYYTDGSDRNITNVATINGTDLQRPSPSVDGEGNPIPTQVLISYTDSAVTRSCYLEVTVYQRASASICIHTMPDKTKYKEGDALDISGLSIDYIDAEGSRTSGITSGFTTVPADGYTLSKDTDTNWKRVTVSYNDCSCDFYIEVRSSNVVLANNWHDNVAANGAANITSIEIVKEYTPDGTEFASWDASEDKNGSVTAYILADGNKLILAGDGSNSIAANKDSTFAFAGKNADAETGTVSDTRLAHVTSITGLELLDVSKAEDMRYMFYGLEEITSLDLSNWSTKHLLPSNMDYMFGDDTKLSSITLGKDFKFYDSNSFLPTPSSVCIDGADGKWYDTTDWTSYTASQLAAIDRTGPVTYSALPPVHPTSMVVSTYPTKTEYVQNKTEELDLTGGAVLITYSDGHAENKGMADSALTVTGFDNTVLGDNTIHITYQEYSFPVACDFTVQIVPRTLTGIAVKTMPVKMTYVDGEGFDSSGLTLTASYDNGQTETVTSGFTTSPAHGTALAYSNGATQTITVSYTDNGKSKTASFTVSVSRLTTAKAILGSNGNLNFVYDNKSYTVGESYTDNIGSTTISKVYTVPTTAQSSSGGIPWYADRASITTANIDDSMSEFKAQPAYWFYGHSNLTSITGLSNLDVSKATSMGSMFCNCSSLTSLDLSSFDTSKVTSMQNMFNGCSSLTFLDVSGFDTSSVAYMGGMFKNCRNLVALDVSGFDTSSVTYMVDMFSTCRKLTSLDVGDWDTSNVTSMGSMFYECRNLTFLNVSGWNTNKIRDMRYMFYDCSGLTSLDVSGFDTSSVTNMEDMFGGCSNLVSLDVSKLDTSKVTNMVSMFVNCSKLTSLDISCFDTSNVTNMSSMFYNCYNLNTITFGPNFNFVGTDGYLPTPSSTYIPGTDGSWHKQPDGTAYTPAGVATYLSSTVRTEPVTFKAVPLTITGITITTAPTKIEYFAGEEFDPTGAVVKATWSNGNETDVTSSVTWSKGELALGDTSVAVSYIENGVTKTANQAVTVKTNTPTLAANDLAYGGTNDWYRGTTDRATITTINIVDSYTPTGSEVESWDASAENNGSVMCYITGTTLTIAGNGRGMIYANASSSGTFCYFTAVTAINGLSTLDTSDVTDMFAMFYSCSSLTSLDLSSWDTSNVTNMQGLFSDCTSLSKINLEDLETGSATNMSYIFYRCSSFTSLDLSGLDTHSATTMEGLFEKCGSLTTVKLDGWNTSNVTNMSAMFCECSNLASLDLSSFDTGNVANMEGMFNPCLRLDTITFGPKFKFAVRTRSFFPTPSSTYIPGTDGSWHKQPDGTAYTPSGVATYLSSTVRTEPVTFKAVPLTITGITITTAPTKVIYNHGDSFDSTGAVVKATWSNGNETDVTSSITWTPNPVTYGTTTVTGTFEGKTVSQTITVNRVLDKIEITTAPTKTTYNHGDSFDATGAVITATYTDGGTADVTSFATWSKGVMSYGDTSVTASYTHNGVTKTTGQAVAVSRVMDHITITAAPTKTEYNHNDSFDKTGAVVSAYYTDSAIGENVTSSVTWTTPSGDGQVHYGDTSVTASYEGKTATQSIIVNHVLDSIAITTSPTKVTYDEEEAFNAAGSIVTAYWTDGASSDVTSHVLWNKGIFALGDSSVTVSYTYNEVTKTADLPVTVNKLYTLTYDANGGTNTPTAQKTSNTSLTMTVDTPEKTDSLFTVWSLDKNIVQTGKILIRSGSVDTDTFIGMSITDYIPVPSGCTNITVYGGTKTQDCNVIHEYDAGKNYLSYWGHSSAARTFTFDFPDSIKYIRASFNTEQLKDCYIYDNTHGQYIFKGSDYFYNPGDTFALNHTDKTLYAIWYTPPVYTLTYDANGGSGGPGVVTSHSISSDNSYVAISDIEPTYSGKTFSGWAKSPSATVPDYVAGGAYEFSTGVYTGTLYAVWNTSVSTDKERRSIDLGYSYATTYFTAGDGMTLDGTSWGIHGTLYTTSKTGAYATLNATAMNALYPNSTAKPILAEYNFCSSRPVSAVGITEVKSALIFDGTSIATTDSSEQDRSYPNTSSSTASCVKNSTKNSSIQFFLQTSRSAVPGMLNTSSGDGYYLALTFAQPEFGASAGNFVSSVTCTGTGTSDDKATAYSGETVTYTATMMPGATFGGWYNAATGLLVSTNQTYSFAATSESKWLIAKGTWNPTYTLTYDANGGTGAPDITTTKTLPITVTTLTPSYADKTFSGWATSRYATVPQYLAGSVFTPEGGQTDCTLYAVWDVNPHTTTETTSEIYIAYTINGNSYLETENKTLNIDYSLLGYQYAVANGAYGGTGDTDVHFTDTAKNLMYPTATAHPKSLQIAYTTMGSENSYVMLQIDGTNVCKQDSTANTSTTYSGILTDSAVLNSTKNSLIRFRFYKKGLTNAVGLIEARLQLSFDRAEFAATAGEGISSASCDGTGNWNGITTAYTGDTVTYTATVANHHVFAGWYDAKTGALVSTNQTYTFTCDGTSKWLVARAYDNVGG